MSASVPGRSATPQARAAIVRESAARRQLRLRASSAVQREQLEAHWQHIVPALDGVDLALDRVRRLRRHPLALGLLALSATGWIVSRRGPRLVGTLRLVWRVGLRAATLASLWRAVRTLAGPEAASRSTAGAADRRA